KIIKKFLPVVQGILESRMQLRLWQFPGNQKASRSGFSRPIRVRLAAHVSNGCKSRIRPVVGRI
ncbi:hypothetical protein AALA98_17945, partial [Lachnospiraceae bacterium 45-W7]